MTAWKGCLPVALLSAGLGFLPMPARAEVSASDMQLIQKLCVASFNNAFAQAGKEAPEGMGAFTCDCWVSASKPVMAWVRPVKLARWRPRAASRHLRADLQSAGLVEGGIGLQ